MIESKLSYRILQVEVPTFLFNCTFSAIWRTVRPQAWGGWSRSALKMTSRILGVPGVQADPSRLAKFKWCLDKTSRLVAGPLISKTISKRGCFGRLEMPRLYELQGLRIERNQQQLRYQTGEGPMAGLAVPIQWSTMCQLS